MKLLAEELGRMMVEENGVEAGCEAFHRQLPLDLLQCELCLHIISDKKHKVSGWVGAG